MVVKRTQLCRTWNGRVDQEDEHVALELNDDLDEISRG